MNIDSNDPKLTAYALGELGEADRAAVEAQVEQSAELRQAVEDIRETARLLSESLRGESLALLTPEQREAVEAKVGTNGRNGIATPGRTWLRRYWIPTSLAASVLIIAGVAWAMMPSLFGSAEERRLVSTSCLKGIGTSSNIYAQNNPEEWATPGRTAPEDGSQAAPADAKPKADPPGIDPTASVATPGLTVAPDTVTHSLLVAPQQNAPPATLGGYMMGRQSQGPLACDPVVRNEAGERYYLYAQTAPGERHTLEFNTEAYDRVIENPFLLVEENPLSTFSIDVDTASYANIRRFLSQGMLPPPGAVRIEEMVNYFDYDYPLPDGDDPFSVNVEIAECPWAPEHRLARIGLKGQEIEADERAPANLVFLIDVSGSMRAANKLPLLKQAMAMLVEQLNEDDQVAIVVYASATGLVLDSTACTNKGPILDALGLLNGGGSTNGGAGIQLAYDTASANFIEGGVNRVILATDGDFNVGVTNQGDLVSLIEERAAEGVFLSVLGFGMGNYKDSTLEKLADKGNGNYAYIDTLSEARKVLVEGIAGTLVTIAKDVKIQIEFNPAEVNAYRLVGYENRLLAKEDFNDDTKDAGEIGAGHTVTAFYEIVPVGVAADLPEVDPLKYQSPPEPEAVDDSGELMTVKLRYKPPDGDKSMLIEIPVTDDGLRLADASDDFAFATSVASFGMLLRGSAHSGDFTYGAVLEMAQASIGEDPHGYRTEFVDLLQKAMELQP